MDDLEIGKSYLLKKIGEVKIEMLHPNFILCRLKNGNLLQLPCAITEDGKKHYMYGINPFSEILNATEYPDYLCHECAIKMGAINNDGGCTWHSNTCEVCKKEKALCHYDDWQWPGVEKSSLDWD